MRSCRAYMQYNISIGLVCVCACVCALAHVIVPDGDYHMRLYYCYYDYGYEHRDNLAFEYAHTTPHVRTHTRLAFYSIYTRSFKVNKYIIHDWRYQVLPHSRVARHESVHMTQLDMLHCVEQNLCCSKYETEIPSKTHVGSEERTTRKSLFQLFVAGKPTNCRMTACRRLLTRFLGVWHLYRGWGPHHFPFVRSKSRFRIGFIVWVIVCSCNLSPQIRCCWRPPSFVIMPHEHVYELAFEA